MMIALIALPIKNRTPLRASGCVFSVIYAFGAVLACAAVADLVAPAAGP
jgi:hypothetical protein